MQRRKWYNTAHLAWSALRLEAQQPRLTAWLIWRERLLKHKLYPFFYLFIGVFLAACSSAAQPTATPTLLPTPTATQPPTLTPEPTLTATPLSPLAVFLRPEQADPALADALEAQARQLAVDRGWLWQVRPSLAVEDLPPNLEVLIAVSPADNLNDLVSAAPQVRFLAVGVAGLSTSGNLSALTFGDERADQIGFLAGAIAAMISPDYRVGILGLKDLLSSQAASLAFGNGRTFFCGMCLPEFPPFYEYPLRIELPAGSTAAEWQTAVAVFLDYQVETVFVFDGAGDAASLQYLADQGIVLIGMTSPVDGLVPHWAATLKADPLPYLESALQAVFDGQAGENQVIPLEITDVNPELLSPGRQRMAHEILQDLMAEFVDPGLETTPQPTE